MNRIISRIISAIRGEKFDIDRDVPISYLVSVIWSRFVSLCYGYLLFGVGKRAFVHPSSKVICRNKISFGKNLSINRGCYIDALSREGIKFGNNVSIGKYTTIECTGTLKDIGKGLVVGNNVGLGSHGFLGCAGGVEIGSDTIFGNYVSTHSENHNYESLELPIRLQGVNRKGIKIGSGCWIGAKATILDGVVLGDGCIVAAGAVVRGVIAKNSIIGGVPAKILKTRDNENR